MKPGKIALSKPRRHWGNFLIKRTATSSTMFLHSHHKNNNIFLGYAHKAADSFNQIGYSIPKHQSGARNITIKDARVKRTKAALQGGISHTELGQAMDLTRLLCSVQVMLY